MTKVPTDSVSTLLAWGLGLALLGVIALAGILYRSLESQIKTLRKDLESSNATCDQRMQSLEQRFSQEREQHRTDIERVRMERDRAREALAVERSEHAKTESISVALLQQIRKGSA